METTLIIDNSRVSVFQLPGADLPQTLALTNAAGDIRFYTAEATAENPQPVTPDAPPATVDSGAQGGTETGPAATVDGTAPKSIFG